MLLEDQRGNLPNVNTPTARPVLVALRSKQSLALRASILGGDPNIHSIPEGSFTAKQDDFFVVRSIACEGFPIRLMGHGEVIDASDKDIIAVLDLCSTSCCVTPKSPSNIGVDLYSRRTLRLSKSKSGRLLAMALHVDGCRVANDPGDPDAVIVDGGQLDLYQTKMWSTCSLQKVKGTVVSVYKAVKKITFVCTFDIRGVRKGNPTLDRHGLEIERYRRPRDRHENCAPLCRWIAAVVAAFNVSL